LRKWIQIGTAAGGAALLALQYFRPVRENPPSDPAASFEAVVSPSREVAIALQRACADCRTVDNQVDWRRTFD